MQPTINSFLCCKEKFALTSGTDRVVRFWDLKEPIDSYRVSSQELGPYELKFNARVENQTAVFEEFVSRGVETKELRAVAEAEEERLARRRAAHRRGLVPPLPVHQDAILDLKAIEYPQKLLVSASRDSMVKVWM